MSLTFSENRSFVARVAASFAAIVAAVMLCLFVAPTSAHAAAQPFAPLADGVAASDVVPGTYATTVQSDNSMFKVFDNKDTAIDVEHFSIPLPKLEDYATVDEYNKVWAQYVKFMGNSYKDANGDTVLGVLGKCKAGVDGFSAADYNVEKNCTVEVDEDGNAVLYVSVTNGYQELFLCTREQALACGTIEALKASEYCIENIGRMLIDYPSKPDGCAYEIPLSSFNEPISLCTLPTGNHTVVEPGKEIEGVVERHIIVDAVNIPVLPDKLTLEVVDSEGNTVASKSFKESALNAFAKQNTATLWSQRAMGSTWLAYKVTKYATLDQLIEAAGVEVLDCDVVEWYNAVNGLSFSDTYAGCNNRGYYPKATMLNKVGYLNSDEAVLVPPSIALGYTTGSGNNGNPDLGIGSMACAMDAADNSDIVTVYTAMIGIMGIENGGGTPDMSGAYNPGYSATKQGDLVRIVIRQAKRVEVPAAAQLTYNGAEQSAFATSDDYVVTDGVQTNAGIYTATVSLAEGNVWADGTTAPKQVEYSIAKAVKNVPVAKKLTYTGKSQAGFDAVDGIVMTKHTAVNAGLYKATVALADEANYCWPDGNSDPKQVGWSIDKAVQAIASAKVAPNTNYNGTLSRTVSGLKSVSAKGAISYVKMSGSKSLTLVPGTDGTCKIKVAAKTPVGSYPVTIRIKAAETANYAPVYRDVTVTVKVTRFTPTITVTGKVVRAINFSATKAKTVDCPITKIQCASKPMTYALNGAKNAGGIDFAKNFKVNATTGAVTIAKGTPKGTYKISMKISSADTPNYKGNWRIVSCTVKVC